MSFGFSVGDFITLVDHASKIRKDFLGAPAQFKAITDEIRNLSYTIQDVEVNLFSRDLKAEEKTELQKIIASCRNLLTETAKTIDNYKELGANSNDAKNVLKRAWKRIRWEPEDIRDLRLRISSNVGLLNSFNGRIVCSDVRRLAKHQDNQERQMILHWLSPATYATKQSEYSSRRQPETCKWLLDTPEFRKWIVTPNQTLFCPGIPGAGKTILSSVIIEELYSRYGNDSEIGISYIYCDYQRRNEQKLEDLLASLLRQFIQVQTSLPDSIKILHDKHSIKATRPTINELRSALHSICCHFSRIYIVIDALDECQTYDGPRSKILDEIFSLQLQYPVGFLATSRFIPDVVAMFQQTCTIEIRASKPDLMRYLDASLDKLPSFVSRNPELQKEIITGIADTVDGMFLLARLYLDSLVGKKSPKAIRIALKELSAGSKSYDSAYSNAMERIEGQVPDQREMAKDILSWITCATRQLTTVELQNALAVELGSCEFDQENLPELDDMVSACAGLVTIDDHSGKIRLVHYTAQEYFLRTWTKWFPKAHYDIAASCVTYLSFDCFKEGPCSTDEEFEARRDRYPLYSYVAQNWGYHAQFQTISTEMVLGLLDDMWKLDACVQAMLAQKKSPGHIMYSQRIPNTLRGLHLAAYLGLEDVVRQLIQRGDQINIRDSFGGTPLTWAARNGREAAVQLLLENGADPSGRDKYGRTPLAWAASTGHEGVVKLLLEEDINPEAEDNDGQTPLVWAASTGHEGVVSLLLEKGADPYSKDNRGLTPLVGAAIGGFAGVVKVLLGKGVDLEQRDEDGKTMTSWAVLAGSDSVVELLLEAGADIESKDHDGRTLLSLAAFDYRGRATKLLLEKGADPESRDNNGRTPLSWAASHHHKIVVKLLLDHGVNPDSKDNEGRTPLSWAAASCISEGVVRLLLEKGADPGSQDKDGRTPMSWAASKGHGAVTKILKAYESKKCFRYQK